MIVTYSDNSYRLSYQGISMVENALENPNLIQISVLSNCTITVAPNTDYGITYLPNGEYRSWNLSGYNTRLNRAEAHYIYARLSRESDNAMILFSVNDYAIDGSIDGEDPSEDFYYIRIGNITETDAVSDATLDREITIDFGYLTTPAGQEDTTTFGDLFELTADNLIHPLKKFASFVVQGTLSIIGNLVINDKQISDVARNSDKGELASDDETLPTTALLTGKYLDYLRGLFLNKDREDQTDFLVRFGDFVDSMTAGKGTGIYPNGRIQTDRIEVRNSMTVMELIFNRLQAMESDYAYSESGVIDEVTAMEDGTYTLKMRKEWEGDFTALQENDVIYGIVNNLASGGGEYYTSWMRVLSVNTSANTLSVNLYPDTEVPGGKNYPPEELMVVSHRGNPVNEDRQRYWYISSNEGRIVMLDGVTKPILEEGNYSVIIGSLPDMDIFDNIPDAYKYSTIYVRNVYTEQVKQVKFPEKLPRVENNRGEWSLETVQGEEPYSAGKQTELTTMIAIVYDTVYHYGCKWMCLADGTTDEPKYGSTGWAMVEGNPAFSIDIDSSQGWYLDPDTMNTTLSVKGTLYNRDVTDSLLDADVSWARDTGNVTEDNVWTTAHAEAGKSITITTTDLGPDYYEKTGCKFICTALLRDGQDEYTDTLTITF